MQYINIFPNLKTVKRLSFLKRYKDKYAEISDITGIAQDKKRMTLTKSADSGIIKTTTNKADIMAEKKKAYDTAQKIVEKYGDKSQLMLFGNSEKLLKYSELTTKAKGYEPPKPKIIDYAEQINNNVSRLSPEGITPAKITKEQESAISSYSKSGYLDINNYLRFGTIPKEIPKEQMLQHIKNLNDLLDANPLKEEIYVKRGINTNALKKLLETDEINENSAIEKVITVKGFMSTTPYRMGGFGGQVQLFIKCPQGTKGTYIADWCANPAEQEFLIAPNQQMIIHKIEKQTLWGEPHYNVFADIILGG